MCESIDHRPLQGRCPKRKRKRKRRRKRNRKRRKNLASRWYNEVFPFFLDHLKTSFSVSLSQNISTFKNTRKQFSEPLLTFLCHSRVLTLRWRATHFMENLKFCIFRGDVHLKFEIQCIRVNDYCIGGIDSAKNKTGCTGYQVACRWAGAMNEKSHQAFGEDQCGKNRPKCERHEN